MNVWDMIADALVTVMADLRGLSLSTECNTPIAGQARLISCVKTSRGDSCD